MAPLGVPWYVPDRFVKQHIRRNLQLELPFPPPTVIPFPKPLPAWKAILRDRQPARFPRGWYKRALSDPDWRVKYAHQWMAKRKAAGLPHIITEPLYLKALQKEKKTA